MAIVGFLLLLLASAFFSGAETAFFSIDRPAHFKLRQQKAAAAARVITLLKRPRDLLIAILFGNVLVNLSYFSLAAVLAAEMRGRPILEGLVHASALFGVIILGEIIPKTLVHTAPAAFAKLISAPMTLWERLSRFITGPLSGITGGSLALVDRVLPPLGNLTNVELARLVTHQRDEGFLAPTLGNLLEDVLLLSQIRVREIMTPRVDIASFDISQGREAFLEVVADVRRSKIPVHRGEGFDEVFGILYLKDVLRRPEAPLEDLIHKAWFIPVTRRLDGLLRDMLNRDAAIAIVVDEYGGTAGLVSIEDVIEEVVGDISMQAQVPPLQAKGPDLFTVSGALSLRDANEALGVGLPEDGATTVAGLISRLLGRLPKEGDEVEVEEGVLTVTKVEKMRVIQVDVRLSKPRPYEEYLA